MFFALQAGYKSLYISLPISIILAIAANIYLIYIMKKTANQQESEKSLILLNAKQNADFENFKQVDLILQHQAKFHHDINNQLFTIQAMIERSGKQEAIEMLEILNQSISTPKSLYSKNLLVDVICTTKSTLINEQNIKFTHEIDLPKHINFPSIEMCSIFSNLLDNSFESCIKSKEKGNTNPFIHLDATFSKGFLSIRQLNSCADISAFEDLQTLKTTKGNAHIHGIGTQILHEIAKNHKGIFKMHCDGNQFTTELLIPIVQNE